MAIMFVEAVPYSHLVGMEASKMLSTCHLDFQTEGKKTSLSSVLQDQDTIQG